MLVTPGPVFVRFRRNYRWVGVGSGMCAGMFIGRGITAKGGATLLTGAQMYPLVPRFYTFFTFISLGCHFMLRFKCGQVFTGLVF